LLVEVSLSARIAISKNTFIFMGYIACLTLNFLTYRFRENIIHPLAVNRGMS